MKTSFRFFRSSSTPVLVTCLVVGALVATCAPAEAQHLGAWKKDWNVRCSWTDRLLFELSAGALIVLFPELAAGGAPELIEELADQNCDDTRIGMAWLAREEFRASSYWLEGLGFVDPIVKLAPDDRKYLAWLDQFHVLFQGTDLNGDTFIRENGFYYPDGNIYISPPMIRAQTAVEAHEQFHGVQNSAATSAYQNKGSYRFHGQWVWEGTARAEDVVWAMKSNQHIGLEMRKWNKPLYFIPSPTDRRPAYRTAPFWIDVGRQLRSRDYIEYLTKVLEGIGASNLPGPSHSMEMLKAVDATIEELLKERGIDMGGLAWAYPEFVRVMLDDPEMADELFDIVPIAKMQLPSPNGGGAVHEFEDDFYIEPIATNVHKVTARVPPGRVGSLRIEVTSDDDPKYKNLHLIVDDRRYDRDQDDPNLRRNVFATTISGSTTEEKFYVRVANVGSPAEEMDDEYTLKITLQSNDALAIATGDENTRLTGGVLFSYVNINRDPYEMANSMQTALIDRYADHAGLSEDTPGGAESREIIADAVASQLGAPPAPPAPGAGRSAVTEGAQCLATITIFDDETRSVAKMMWRGGAPFLGNTHEIKGSFATGVHDSIYATLKTTGQELTMLESPEALARYMEELQGLSLPGLEDAMRMAGDEAAAAEIQSVLGGLLGGLDVIPSREGRVPSPNRGQDDFGRSYGEHATGTLEIEPSYGDRIVGRFNFHAVDTNADKAVDVEGQFIAIPRPLSEDNLWNGCELMTIPAEDNGNIQIAPAVYPPGFESPEEEEEDICAEFPTWIACVCALSPLVYPELCWPDDPVDCRYGDPVDTVIEDWHEVTNANGERVERRKILRTWPVLEPPRNGGQPCPKPEVISEERPIPDDTQDCRVGDPVDTVIDQWHEVVNDKGERVERRRIRREWPVIEPPRNGGKPCPPPFEFSEERPVSDDCVDCEVGRLITTVVRNWHVVEIGGKKYWRRVVRRQWEILQEPSDCGKPCPPGKTEAELRPITEPEDETPPSPIPGTGSDPGGGGTPKPPTGGGKPAPPGGDVVELGPKLILDFLEEGPANLRSSPQEVKGSASPLLISVAATKFNLGMALTDARIASCGFNMSVRMGLKMLASGKTLKGGLKLDASTGRLTLKLDTKQGVIGVTGKVSLSPAGPTSIRGDVVGGTLDLDLDQGSFSCKDLMSFSFTLTQVP